MKPEPVAFIFKVVKVLPNHYADTNLEGCRMVVQPMMTNPKEAEEVAPAHCRAGV